MTRDRIEDLTCAIIDTETNGNAKDALSVISRTIDAVPVYYGAILQAESLIGLYEAVYDVGDYAEKLYALEDFLPAAKRELFLSIDVLGNICSYYGAEGVFDSETEEDVMKSLALYCMESMKQEAEDGKI